MTTLATLQAQNLVVLGFSFALAVLAGVLIHRRHFCTMGALSDLFVMGDALRLRQWALAVAVAMVGFGSMTALGWISPLHTIYAAPRLSWLSLLLGGSLFGAGMVLASGCASKSLSRLGAGNLKSLVVLMAMGMAALASLRGLLAVGRVSWLDPVSVALPTGPFVGQALAAMTGWPLPAAWGLSAAGIAALLLVWVFQDPLMRQRGPFMTGAGMGAVVVALWWVSGVLGFVPEHPETLEPVFLATASGRMEAFSLTAPVAQWWDALLYFSDGSKRITLGMATAAGILLGSWASALQDGSFRWEGFTQTPDLALHLLGGVLMGVGGVMAMGCTFGQGLSGLSTLSWGSVLAVLGIVAGAWLALKWQMTRAEAMA